MTKAEILSRAKEAMNSEFNMWELLRDLVHDLENEEQEECDEQRI